MVVCIEREGIWKSRLDSVSGVVFLWSLEKAQHRVWPRACYTIVFAKMPMSLFSSSFLVPCTGTTYKISGRSSV